jgi:hypothetical protein
MPSRDIRGTSTLQAATLKMKRNIDRYGDDYYLAVFAERRWAGEEITHQRFAVAVELEHEAQIDIHCCVENSTRVRIGDQGTAGAHARDKRPFSPIGSCQFSALGASGHHDCRRGHVYFPHTSGWAKFSAISTSPTSWPSIVKWPQALPICRPSSRGPWPRRRLARVRQRSLGAKK